MHNPSVDSESPEFIGTALRVFRHKRMIVGVMIFVLGLFILYALTATPLYKVSTKILYKSSTKSSSLMALASLTGMSLGGGNGDASAYLEDIIRSADFLAKVVEKSWALETPVEGHDSLFLKDLWEMETDTTIPFWQVRLFEKQIRRLAAEDRYILFSKESNTGVIELTTVFEDPLVAYEINQFLFAELNNVLVSRMTFEARTKREFIGNRLGEVQRELVQAEEALLHFRERNLMRSDPQALLQEGRLAREVTVQQELMLQLQKQYELAKIEEAKDLPVLEVLETPRKPLEKYKPQRRLLAMTGLVVGCFLGVLFALFYDLWLENKRRLAAILKGRFPDP